MKIKPLEKKENRLIKLKLAFLLFLIITTFTLPFLIKEPAKNNPPKKENVLGSQTNLQTVDLSKLKKDINQTSQHILTETKNYLNQTRTNAASQAGKIFSSFIYNTTIKPIIGQIQRLPQDQLEKIKKEICQ